MGKLIKSHYVIVVLRLLVDERRRLLGGEVMDRGGKPQGRFIGWSGLQRRLLDWLSSLDPGDPQDPIDPPLN